MFFVVNDYKVQFITKMCVVIHDNNVHYDDNVQFITKIRVVIQDDNVHYEYIKNMWYHHDEMCAVINNDNVH